MFSSGEISFDGNGSVPSPESDGTLIVPWSSRIARPDGVWRSCGRGFSGVAFGVDDAWFVEDGGCRRIEGIVDRSISVSCGCERVVLFRSGSGSDVRWLGCVSFTAGYQFKL